MGAGGAYGGMGFKQFARMQQQRKSGAGGDMFGGFNNGAGSFGGHGGQGHGGGSRANRGRGRGTKAHKN